MTMAMQHSAGERAGGAFSAALVHALLAAALIWGLGAPVPRAVERTLKLFEVAPPPPPPPAVSRPRRQERAERERRHSPGREGAASPANIRSQATQIVAPLVLPLKPPPVVAAPVAGAGNDASSGAADVRGPGTGAGGFGDGSGSGAGGDGDGGGGYGRGSPPRHLRGRLGNSDYPADMGAAGAGGTVSVRFTVATDGRAVACRITRSSGHAALDAHTCRLIERRYRFDPSRDGRGRPILSDVVEDHEWIVRDEPPERRGYD